MGALAAGQVVLLPFPFSDLSQSKLRPALLIATDGKNDWVSCQITSNPYADRHAIELRDKDFSQGGLKRTSYARPAKLFTAHESVGTLAPAGLTQVRNAIITIIRG